MAAKKPAEPKVELEREYIVPLRKGWLKVPKYKRANKAMKTLKEFIAKHMKVYDRDLRKIKVDELINNEIRFRGMYKPVSKIKVKVKKYDNGIVRVELVNLPAHVKFAQLREEKKKAELDKKTKANKVLEQPQPPVEPKPGEKTEETKKEKEAEEKEASGKEESLRISKEQAKTQKHVAKDQQVERQTASQRKALSR